MTKPLPMLSILLTLAASTPVHAAGCGDLTGDGRTDIADVVAALRMSVRLTEPTAEDVAEADVAPLASLDATTVPPTATPRPNDTLNVGDVVQLLRFSVGLSALPGCAPAAVPVPRLGHVTHDEICSGGSLTLTITNPGRLPVGDARWSGGTVTMISERDVPGGSERVVSLAPATWQGQGVLSVDGALGTLAVRASDCDIPLAVAASPSRVAAGQGASVWLAGDGLLCVTSVSLRGPGGDEVEAPIVEHVSNPELRIQIPDHPWAAGTELEILLRSACGTNVPPRPRVTVDASEGPGPDATSVRFEATGLPVAGTENGGPVVIEGARLGLASSVRFGSRDVRVGGGCSLAGESLRCNVGPPAGAFASVTERVTVFSPSGADPTPLELSWLAAPVPRCGDLVPSVAAAGSQAMLEIVGENLQGIQRVLVADVAWEAWSSEDGRRLTIVGFVPLGAGEVPVSLGDVTCPVALTVR